MRGWQRATFLFISTQDTFEPGGVEDRWFALMEALVARGATVRFLAPLNTEIVERARELGFQVDPYMLDKWNVVRTRSRLRKYLKRYQPSVAHSTGAEADLLLRWAARRVETVRVAHTLRLVTGDGLRRTLAILGNRFAALGLGRARLVFAESEGLVQQALAAGIPQDLVLLDPPAAGAEDLLASVEQHLAVYRRLISE